MKSKAASLVHRNGPLNILVIGAGMYTCGRGTDGFGTILPALIEWKRTRDLGDVIVAGTSPAGIKSAKKKVGALERATGVDLGVSYLPGGNTPDPCAYRKALAAIPRPACAIIAVPDDHHRCVAEDVMKGGLHALVVKPLAPTLKEVKDLVALQQKEGVYGAVEFHKRFDKANIKLRDAVQSDSLGEPLYAVVEYSQRKSVPTKHFRKWVDDTNIFQYLGIHYVDIVEFVTGAVPLRAMALGQKRWLRTQGIDAYDAIEAVIEWVLPSKKTFVSVIVTNWIDPESSSAMSDQKIKVIGTKGRFESDQKRRGITVTTDGKGVEEPNPYFTTSCGPMGSAEYSGYGIESVHQFLGDVLRIERGICIPEDLEGVRPTFSASIGPTSVIEAVNRSLATGGAWVAIKGKTGRS